MKPKKTVLEKQKTDRRKNRSHWSSHKEQIIRKRSLQKGKITASQLLDFHGAQVSEPQIDRILGGLNINEREKEMNIQSNNDEDLTDHLHLDEYLSDVNELSVGIEESDRSDNEADDDESLHQLEKETLQEFIFIHRKKEDNALWCFCVHHLTEVYVQ